MYCIGNFYLLIRIKNEIQYYLSCDSEFFSSPDQQKKIDSKEMPYLTIHIRNFSPPVMWKGLEFVPRLSFKGFQFPPLREISRRAGLDSNVTRFNKLIKQRLIDWRDRQNEANSDFKIRIDGAGQEYKLHLSVLSRSSGFFFNVANGNVKQIQLQWQDVPVKGETSNPKE